MTPFLILGGCMLVIYYLDHEHSHIFLSGVFLMGVGYYLYVSKGKSLTSLIQPLKDPPIYAMVSNDQKKKISREPLTPLKKFLKRLKPYRKYNKISYDSGRDYLRQFSVYIVTLQEKPEHPRHTYENAESSYRAAINEFQSLSLSVPSHTLTHKLSDSSTIKDHSHTIGLICKELRTYCHHLLHSFSTDINKDTYTSPDIYKSEIVQHDIVGYNIVNPHELY